MTTGVCFADSPNRDTTGSPVVTGPSPPPLERHSNSPLTVPMPSLTTGQYILHPPLPNITSPPKMVAGTHQPLSSVPILLNPDLMHGTPIPIISSQVRGGCYVRTSFSSFSPVNLKFTYSYRAY